MRNCGIRDVVNQNNGMILQAGFKGDIYGNTIIRTANQGGVGLLYQGSLGSRIYNNVVSVMSQTPFSASVNSARSNPGTFLYVQQNTFVGLGVRGLNTFFQAPGPVPTTQIIENNVITWVGTVGQTWECLVLSPAATSPTSSNVCFRNAKEDPSWAFVNAALFDYHLQPTSTLRNAGVDTGIATDFDGTPRVAPFDIGAFEYSAATTAGGSGSTAAPTTTTAGGSGSTAAPATTGPLTSARSTTVSTSSARPVTTAAAGASTTTRVIQATTTPTGGSTAVLRSSFLFAITLLLIAILLQ